MLTQKEVKKIIKESYAKGFKMGLLVAIVAVIIIIILK